MSKREFCPQIAFGPKLQLFLESSLLTFPIRFLTHQTSHEPFFKYKCLYMYLYKHQKKGCGDYKHTHSVLFMLCLVLFLWRSLTNA